jgi:hypothetical protein
VPLVAGGHSYNRWDAVLQGLSNGTDPRHPEFWGEPGAYDQRLVEMAAIAYAIGLIPDRIWDPLSKRSKRNLTRWLGTINQQKVPRRNWIFFRILVNCALRKVGAGEYNAELLRQSLQEVESYYIDGGWYNDGNPKALRARDYYISWAIHYYSLILTTCYPEVIPDLVAVYQERAAAFAADFVYWFTEDGAAIPYGRSLTYRFAQGAFWAALAFGDCEALPWGKIKGLYLRHLRWWLRQPIFSETGLQTIGYCYPNLHLAERYNSANSPLWALKAFIALAVSDDHPFWKAVEEPLRKAEETHVQPQTGMILSDTSESGHLYALNSGQWAPGESNEHNHMAEKYAKFAYSAYFGFNVATDTYGIDKLGHDNMLMVSLGDRFFRHRMETADHVLLDETLCSTWKPFPTITITTFLTLAGPWSIRLHRIDADTDFSTIEGGFALPYNDSSYPLPRQWPEFTNEAWWQTRLGFSGIRNICQPRRGRIVVANPNANNMYAHTLIPSLIGEYPTGCHWLGCAVLAHPEAARGKRNWRHLQDFSAIVQKMKRFPSAQRINRG